MCFVGLLHASVCICMHCVPDRKKFVEWGKKLEKLEGIQLQFEVSAVGKPSMQVFLDEVNEKLEHMLGFKKVWGKFAMGGEAYLKKGEPLTVHTPSPHPTLMGTSVPIVYACLALQATGHYIYIYIYI